VAVVTRREMLRGLWRMLGFAALAETAAAVGVFLWPRKPKPREGAYGGTVTAGPVDTFEPGSVTAFAKGQFYLVRLQNGGFLALSRKCTHLGCTVPWSETDRKFACPCHASSFDETGGVLSAPAPRPLDLYRVTIADGVVKVDTSVARVRDRSDPSQAVRG
jgi:cytochrome b6-f complex iron-sulfur subunit